MFLSFCDGHLKTDTLGDDDILAETAKGFAAAYIKK